MVLTSSTTTIMTTTDKVNKLLLTITKTELSQELGISRPTLDSRLEGKSKWKKN